MMQITRDIHSNWCYFLWQERHIIRIRTVRCINKNIICRDQHTTDSSDFAALPMNSDHSTFYPTLWHPYLCRAKVFQGIQLNIIIERGNLSNRRYVNTAQSKKNFLNPRTAAVLYWNIHMWRNLRRTRIVPSRRISTT
jgi:hypothetical protein